MQSKCVRYAIGEPQLPEITETLPLADQTRRALMSLYSALLQRAKFGEATPPAGERFVSEVFSGKNAAGEALTGHGHAYFLPTDEDEDGRIDHLTVVATRGFDAAEVQALDRLRSLRFGAGEGLRLQLVGLGTERDMNAPMFRSSRVWESATPFVVTRHAKRRGQKKDPPELLGRGNEPAFVAAVLAEELDRLRQRRPEIPAPSAIVPLPEIHIGPLGLRPFEFERFRRKAGDDGGQRPTGAFRLIFPTSVAGPLCLGHSCHFGLGLFLPAARGREEAKP